MNDLLQPRPKSARIRLGLALLVASACHQTPQPSRLSGGTIVGNGGNEVTCAHVGAGQPAGDPVFDGTYMLDYVVTYDPRLGAADDVGQAGWTWADYRASLEAFLADKLPAALPSFRGYADLLDNADDSQERVWKATTLALVPLDDTRLVQQLPSNCAIPGPDGTPVPNLTQLVHRQEITTDTTRKVFYYYNFDRVQALRQHDPLQYSYLVVHEWLWDFTDAPQIVRLINHMLHSRQAARMTRAGFAADLTALGISVDATGVPGPQGAQESALKAVFAGEPLCDLDHVQTAEVLPYDRLNRVVLAPQQSRQFDVQIPVLDELATPGQPARPFTACGFAFVMTYRATGASAAPFTVQLQRGVAPPFVRPLTAELDPTPRQDFYSGLCLDRPCIFRDGLLSQLLTYQNFSGSRWRLTVTNDGTGGGAGNVELLSPYFVFTKMRDQ